MTDSFQTDPYYVYSGSYTDLVHYGDPLRPYPDLNRQVIFSRASVDDYTTGSKEAFAFALKRMMYSERLGFISGSYIGSRTQNLGSQAFDQEQVYDSFVPSPVDIIRTNGVTLMTTSGTAGALTGSELFNIPPSVEDIPIPFGQEVPPSISPILGGIDFTWMDSRTPFASKYKGLQRILQPSFFLPQPYSINLNFADGSWINHPVQRNILGTLYYTNKTPLESNSSFLFNSTETIPPIFTTLPSFNVGLFAADANSFNRFLFDEKYQVVVGESGSIASRKDSEANFTIRRSPHSSFKTLRGISHSRTSASLGGLAAWVAVGDEGTIIKSDSPNGSSWSSNMSIGGYTGTFHSVACAKQGGVGNTQSGIFVAVGDNAMIQYSFDREGTSWIIGTPPPSSTGISLRSIDWSQNLRKFIVCGDGGKIYLASSNYTVSGPSPWTDVTPSSVSVADLHCIRENPNTGVFYAVGKNGTILAAFDPSFAWAKLTPAGGYTGTFRGIGFVHDTIIVVGDGGEIQYGLNDGDSWVRANIPNFTGDFHFIGDEARWTAPVASYENPKPLIIGGPVQTITKPGAFIRVTDIDTSGSVEKFFGPYSGNFVNDAALIQTGGLNLPASSMVTRSTYIDLLKGFYGVGPGFSIDFRDAGLISPTTVESYLRNRSVDYRDFKIVTDATFIETVRLIGPQPRGFGYGVANVTPQHIKATWNRSHYGQFRDMLEQRPFTKTFTPAGGGENLGGSINNNNTLNGPVSITFVSGTSAYSKAIDYTTASNPDYNPNDSGYYDIEYRSGQPFFDNRSSFKV